MKKHNRFWEDDKAMPPKKDGDGGADGAKADHEDADQDKALFAKMIKQYLGKDDADETEVEMAKQAYQAHKEAGMKHDEAMEGAGKHLKMAAEIGKKMHQAMMKASEKKEAEGESEAEKHEKHHEKAEHEGEAEHESEAEGEAEAEKHEKHEKHEKQMSPDQLKAGKKEKKHESASVALLAGEVAKLRESVKHYEMKDYLDSKLRKSGESNQCTKLFREALGKPRSAQHIDETWNTFIKAYKAGAEEVGSDDALFTEKNAYRNDSAGKKSLSDCIR